METSVKQAASRMLSIHASALYRMSKGLTAFTTAQNAGEAFEFVHVRNTLCKWEAMKSGRITAKGTEILARFMELNPWWKPSVES